MAIRIRVYPQGMAGINGGMGFNRFGGGAVTAQRFYSTQLQNQRRLSNVQLGYERALWNERLEKVRLEERLKNPYAQMTPYAGVSPLGVSPWGMASPLTNSWLAPSMLGGAGFFNGLGLGGMF